MAQQVQPGSIHGASGYLRLSLTEHKTATGGGIAPAIAVFVFGKQGYYAAAEHLALTAQVNSPSTKVVLWAAEPGKVDHTLFAAVHQLPEYTYVNGPGTMKVGIYDLLPVGDWLVMDADMMVIKDLTPYIERLKAHDFAMEYMGKGPEDSDLGYSPWATTDTMRRVGGLPIGTTFHGVQSSWMWVRKPSKVAADIFDKANVVHYGIDDLKERWGFDIPDEVRFATAVAQAGIPLPDIKLSFYGGRTSYGFSGIEEPLLCLYGDARKHRLVTPSWLSTYDTYLRSLYYQTGRTLRYPLHRVMQDKYVNR